MKVVNAPAAELLDEFRSPISALDAVAAYARKRRADPRQTLNDALPLLRSFLLERLLVLADTGDADQIEPDLEIDRIGTFSINGCVQVSNDTELYQGRSDDGVYGAIKLARPDSARGAFFVQRETDALEKARGAASPRILEQGLHQERPFVAMEWCRGVQAGVLAREHREDRSGRDGRKLLQLCVAILDAYDRLHHAGVIHGDVHPHNVLVDDSGKATVIDYELSRLEGEPETTQAVRGGTGYYFEPEYAYANIADEPVPVPTQLGEQYSLAVLLYHLLTGAHYLDFSPYRTAVLQQVVDEEPRTFASVGVRAWPEVEAILGRALSKKPPSRFRSVAAFSRVLSDVKTTTKLPLQATDATLRERFLERVVSRMGLDGPLIARGIEQPPTASVNYGAAGVAYGLYRIACASEDPVLLAAANVWLARAHESASTADGFRHRESQDHPAIPGPVSLYHSACGICVVEATLARAEGDGERLATAIASFASSSRQESPRLDLTLGEASVLLACAILSEVAINEASGDLIERGNESLERLIDALPEADRATVSGLNWGIAHGWAGVLYSILRWCDVSGKDIPHEVESQLVEVAARATRWGRGMRWPWVDEGRPVSGPAYMPGWCNGSAGFVHLWLLAHQLLGDEEFFRLAEGAAWHAWEAPKPEAPDLCCGLSGRAYALLALYRHTDDVEWLGRGRSLADRAVAAATSNPGEYRDSLYRGDLGVAVLGADLTRPDDAAMPLFESERWPTPK